MGLKLIRATLTFSFLLTAQALALTESSNPMDLSPAELEQKTRFEADPYCQHILAVDADGNALLPTVTQSRATDNSPHYSAAIEILAGEDTRNAKLDPDALQSFFRPGSHPDDTPAIRNVLHGRKLLYLYLDNIFKAIEREHPDEVVVHVHGGLNKILGAIEKTALISDDLRVNHPPDHRIFYIGVCWNSDLYPTYTEHLFSVREGLRQPGKAIVTAPAMLLSDIGTAACRLPLNLINFLYQDAYTVHPDSFKRTQLAQTRVEQIRDREAKDGSANTLVISPAPNDRPDLLRHADAAQWLVTQPAKVATTFFLDWLGSEPWKNMLRRTRTMFERESEFIPTTDYATAQDLARILTSRTPQPVNADTLLDQLNSTGRQGAVAFFCSQAQTRLLGAAKRPRITLIGHSMGAIVSCEILERFHQLTLDNVVFMGAACSINDFRTKVIPYLQEQNLRESLRAQLAGEWKTKLSRLLQSQGTSASSTSALQRQADLFALNTETPKTRFYDLCLHDTVENGEKNPGETDLVQRGSLLTWIDVLYQKPESENDRTFGRWVNAILSTDSLPGDVVNRITIKEFGADRPLRDYLTLQDYAYRRGNESDVQEPMHHGDFGRFKPGAKNETTNLAFWRELYRLSEFPPVAASSPTITTRAITHKRVTAAVSPPPAATPSSHEKPATRAARTGF